MTSEPKDLFKNLRKMQEKLWSDTLKGFDPHDFSRELDEWQEKTFSHMKEWANKAMTQSLELQKSWIEQWSERVSSGKLKPKAFSDLHEEATESMHRWMSHQRQLWDQWFGMIETKGDSAAAEAIGKWRKAVHDSFDQQTKLLNDWSKRADFKKMNKKELEKAFGQVQKTMDSWIQTQRGLWDHWLHPSQVKAPESPPVEKKQAKPKSTAKPAAKKKTKAKKKKATKSSGSDDLKKIKGIGPALEKKLNAEGITSYTQIANLKAADVAKLEENVVRFPGRIKRDGWVAQAKQLAKGSG